MTVLRFLIWAAVSTTAQAADDHDSLPSQERQARAFVESQNGLLVDVLRVPGHSRRYIDIHECAADMRAQGIDAFDKLLAYWESRAFDVLVCRDADRFARSQSLHAYVVERTIEIGARLYSFKNGWIDRQNFRMFISFSGYAAASEIETMQTRVKVGIQARVERGLHPSRLPFSHRLIRDPLSGKGLRVEPVPDHRQLLDDVALLLLDGVPWNFLERELLVRFGHLNPATHKQYSPLFFYNLLYNPWFWGHSASGHRMARKVGGWVYDASIPEPPDVTLYRDTHAPAYSGDQAERVKAELRRRESLRGSATPNSPFRFTGLLVCADCGRHMVACRRERKGSGRVWIAYFCNSLNAAPRQVDGKRCPNHKFVPETLIQTYLDQLLLQWLNNFPALLPSLEAIAPPETHTLAKEIKRLEDKIREMIIAQAEAAGNPSLYSIYTEQIHTAGDRLEGLLGRQREVRRDAQVSQQKAREQRLALAELQQLSLDGLWAQTPRFINQFLRRLFYRVKLVVKDGQIIGLRQPP